MLVQKMLTESFDFFYKEDDLSKNFKYVSTLSSEKVLCTLKFKDDLKVSGLAFFFEAFNYLEHESIDYSDFLKYEGKEIYKDEKFEIQFELPFHIVLSGERLALNLLQKACAIATNTDLYVKALEGSDIKILDTRKTTPGLRFLEKYAVQSAGGLNHRFNQTDVWMIKDNHKSFFGGTQKALEYFRSINSFYTPIVVEIHSIEELREGLELNINHFMLDNFTPNQIEEAIKLKKEGVTFEVSGGISLDNIQNYKIEGVDAISSGSLTYNSKHVDISLKYSRK